MTPAEMAVRLMVARNPHETADTYLELLQALHQTRAIALFAVAGEDPILFVGRGVGQEQIDWARVTWRIHLTALERGDTVVSESRTIVPLMRDGSLAALLYVQVERVDAGAIAETAPLLVEAAQRGTQAKRGAPSPVEAFLEQTPPGEVEKRQLVLLLQRHEWNVARVAREMGITRTTVYKRLATFGITRKRVPKSRPRLSTS